MKVEHTSYVIWAADMDRAVQFYTNVFGATVRQRNDAICTLDIAGSILGIHGGGEGKPTWTGLAFQTPDVVTGAAEVVAAGGTLRREPQPEGDEPPHLAMCADTEGNQFMLTRRRHSAN